jgi:hypothetical protein
MTDLLDFQQRPPPFRSTSSWTLATAAAALFCVSLLFVWSANDASFGIATWKAKVCLRLQSISWKDPEMGEALGIMDAMRTIQWDRLGKRVIVLYVLYGIGTASTVALVLLTIQKFTAKRLVICVSILGAWSALVATRTTVDDWRARRQVATILTRFEQAAAALRDKWPTGSGEIPPGIRFYVLPEKYPDVLTLRRRNASYPFHEDFGLMINRGENGIIRFDLAAAFDSCVEYHPNGTLPSAHTAGFGYPSPPVASVTKLKEKWYLVRYGGS